jgi:D-alanyl-D-alanine carboxypeptidase
MAAPLPASARQAQAGSSTTGAPPQPDPRGWALVDADTGLVLQAGNHRQALPVASLTKVISALAIVHNLPPATPITISARAQGMPARNINAKEGQVWSDDHLLHALLMSSANDAAVALAEKTAGSVEGFQGFLADEAFKMQLADHPLLQDPAGLDDEFSVGGGNLVSARDMAIAARALLHDTTLAPIVATKVYAFHGGDGIDHRLSNHNRMLWDYAGAIGMKTGYTAKAQECRVAVAQRNGRTMIAVVIGALPGQDTSFAAHLLDAGFAMPAVTEPTTDRLPPVPGTATQKVIRPAPVRTGTAAVDTSSLDDLVHSLPLQIAMAVLILLGLLRARAISRQRRPRPSASRRR